MPPISVPTESRLTMNNELQELTAEICETVDWPEFHRVDATQNEQVRAILERFMAKHYQYEDALVAAIPKMMQQVEKAASSSLLPVGRQLERRTGNERRVSGPQNLIECNQCKHKPHDAGLCDFGLADGECPCNYQSSPRFRRSGCDRRVASLPVGESTREK